MSAAAAPHSEAVGEAFSLAAMVRARDLTFEAVRRVAGEIRPGVTEARGAEIAQEVLMAMGMERLWHRNVVRFGPGTLQTFHGEFSPDYVLKAKTSSSSTWARSGTGTRATPATPS